MSWKNDTFLSEDLRRYVAQNMKRKEISDYIYRDYSHHFPNSSLSLRTLDRILQYFQIKYIDYGVQINQVESAIKEEVKGTGKNLGYRALANKIRQVHGLNVPRNLVYATLTNIDPSGLEKRRPCLKRKRQTGHYSTKGVNWFLSIDGHDKLMGYQNSTFPIAIYGIMDQASRKILFLKCWTSNSSPFLIGKWYIDWLKENRILASNIRLDRGSETGKLAAIHSYLRGKVGDLDDPLDSVTFGPSTSNQIERWWRELHERLEKRLKRELHYLMNNQLYNPQSKNDRDILAFIMVPVMQRELDIFRESVWNTHRIRFQRGCYLPSGIPNHIYDFPNNYNLEQCSFPILIRDIEEAEIYSGTTDAETDFLDARLRSKFESLVPCPSDIPINRIVTAYRYLKESLSNFNSKQIDEICEMSRIKPAVLQCESHIYFNQNKLIEHCKKYGIAFTAFSPLGTPDSPFRNPDDPVLMQDEKIIDIGKKYNKSAAQICLKFHIQRGLSVAAKSVTPSRIQANAQLFDFEISAEDMKTLMSLNKDMRYIRFEFGYSRESDGKAIKASEHPFYPYSIPY